MRQGFFPFLAFCLLSLVHAAFAGESPEVYCSKNPDDLKCLTFFGSKSNFQSQSGNIAGSGKSPATDNSRFIVFLHSGGGPSGVAEEVAARLKAEGFLVRGIDAQTDAVGGPGVDYFDPRDLSVANAVGEIASGLLPPEFEPLAPRFQSVDNPQGYLGIWLYGRSQDIDAQTWSSRPPTRGWCVQSDTVGSDVTAYLTRCFRTRSLCEGARLTRATIQSSPCGLVRSLGESRWTASGEGDRKIWYRRSGDILPPPFPQLSLVN